MSKTNNIDNIAEGLDNAPILAKLQAQNSLRIPDGYFDKLEDDIMSQIDTMPIEEKSRFSINRSLYYVAAASVAILISFFVFKSVDKNTDSDFIAEENQNIEAPISVDNNETHIVKETSDNSIENNNKINNIESVETKQEVIIAQNNAPVIENVNHEIEGEKLQRKPETMIESDTPEEFVADNSTISDNGSNITPINAGGGAYATNTNSSQQSSTHSSTARVGDNSNINLILPKDTCLNKAFVIELPEDSVYKAFVFVWNDDSNSKHYKISESGVYYLDFYKVGKLIHTDTMVVQIVDYPEPNIIPEIEICNHQSVLINTGLNDKVYHHNWSINSSHKSEILLENLDPGAMDLSLTIASCCDTIVEIIALNVQDCRIEIPNVITPNNDGYNDAFVVKGLEYYPNSSLNTFDRNGKLIYKSLDYKNDWKAEGVATGTYFYSIIINDKLHTEKGGVIKVMR